MVNTDRAGGRNTGAVPARIVNSKVGIRNVFQFDQRYIHVGLRHAEGRAALVLRE